MVAAGFEYFAVYRRIFDNLARKSETFQFSAIGQTGRRRRVDVGRRNYRIFRRRAFDTRAVHAPGGFFLKRFAGGRIFYGTRAKRVFAASK